MGLTAKVIKKWIGIATANGATKIKINPDGAIEMELGGPVSTQLFAAGAKPITQVELNKSIEALSTTDAVPSDEDILHWSSGGLLPSEAKQALEEQFKNPELSGQPSHAEGPPLEKTG